METKKLQDLDLEQGVLVMVIPSGDQVQNQMKQVMKGMTNGN
jgi:hypothetical protein